MLCAHGTKLYPGGASHHEAVLALLEVLPGPRLARSPELDVRSSADGLESGSREVGGGRAEAETALELVVDRTDGSNPVGVDVRVEVTVPQEGEADPADATRDEQEEQEAEDDSRSVQVEGDACDGDVHGGACFR